MLIIFTIVVIHCLITALFAIKRGVKARTQRKFENTHDPNYWPSVSVIIPAWCERGTLENCIQSLKNTNYPNWEIIIVAGGIDNTYQAAIDACIGLNNSRVIQQMPKGKNAALNDGFRESNGEVIVLLDSDSKVSQDWIYPLVKPVCQGTKATMGRLIPSRTTPISLGEQMEWISSYEVHRIVTLQGSGSIAIQRSLIENMGGFPEDITVGVDWDLDARLALQGITGVYCPNAVVYSERPATVTEYWRNEIRWRRAHLQSLFRIPDYFLRTPVSTATNLYIYALAWFTLIFTVVAGIALLAGNIQITALWLTFLFWVLARRASLAIEVTAYTRYYNWLKLAWVAPLLLCITILAILPASLTWRKKTVNFKGPRVKKSSST